MADLGSSEVSASLGGGPPAVGEDGGEALVTSSRQVISVLCGGSVEGTDLPGNRSAASLGNLCLDASPGIINSGNGERDTGWRHAVDHQACWRGAGDMCGKAVAMTQEACHYLGGSSTGPASPGAALLSSCLTALAELLTSQAEMPHVWVGLHSSSCPRLNELLRFGMLEIQEHRETFLDRKDRALECMDTVKTTVKLQLLGECLSSEEVVLDLGRALYKVHFQLLLLIEVSNKMVAAIAATAHSKNDMSLEVAAMKANLVRAMEEVAESDLGTPTPPPSAGPGPPNDQLETSVLEHLQGEKWTAVLRFVRRNRSLLFSELLPGSPDEDITGILNIYCRHLANKKSDIFVVTCTEQDLNDTFSQLMDSLFQVLGAVNGLDSQLREQREHSETTMRKTEC
ncbi:hypothetical protein PR048_021963 [Dryococelus australis]|uniref:Protein furry C-terminal domain-containing protein n=1 Tax=Dryococelus australis TaxID=614101 RepID=A0ABQ9GZW2_9NEOP|nr:hypothetical protein PR048_021963 [Dryococelus australis]